MEVYLIKDDYKCLFFNKNAFIKRGYSFENVIEVANSEVLSLIPQGDILY
jgi:hypothetical protein